jgi:hypothetical protein
MEKQIYHGYTIEEETNPWRIKYGGPVRYSTDSENVLNAKTIEEAKEQIDETINENI